VSPTVGRYVGKAVGLYSSIPFDKQAKLLALPSIFAHLATPIHERNFGKPPMPTDPTFRMTVQEIFSIKSRGTVVTGQIESGTITVGDEIRIQGKSSSKTTVVTGVEVYRKVVTRAQAGDNVGVLLKDINKEDVQQGDVLTGSEFDFTWKA
jgi:translation elongation factor EF-Tu-like GTPase